MGANTTKPDEEVSCSVEQAWCATICEIGSREWTGLVFSFKVVALSRSHTDIISSKGNLRGSRCWYWSWY